MIYIVAIDPAVDDRRAGRIAEWLAANVERTLEPVPRVFIVDGSLAAEQIASGLGGLLDARDRLVIVKGATEAVWRGMPPEVARRLAESFPGSITERIPHPAEGTAPR